MKIKCYALLVILFLSQIGIAQKEKLLSKIEFTPVGLVFANVHMGKNAFTDEMAFEIRRAYVGYKFKFDEHFSGELVLDMGNPEDTDEGELGRRFAFFKKAYLKYKNGKLSLSAGMVSTRQFKVQEKIWAYRYIGQSPMDRYRMGPSADLGIIAQYQFNEVFDLDLSVTNGEGYSDVQMDTAFRCALGLTLKPIKSLLFRFYIDVISKHIPLNTYSVFISYNYKSKVVLGLEADYQTNTQFFNNREFYIYSGFLNYYFIENWSCFARVDRVFTNESIPGDGPWNITRDGYTYWGGFDYAVNNHIKLALDLRYHIPDNKEERNQPFIYLHSQLKL